MPGPDWRDLRRRGRGSGAAPAAVGQAPSTPPEGPALPAPLERLMEERRALEQRMQRLTGAAIEDPRSAALYQVRPMAERRAEHGAWEHRRRAETARAAAGAASRRRRGEEDAAARLDRAPAAGDPAPPLRATPGERLRRGPRGTPVDPDVFLAAREGLASAEGRLREADRTLREAGADGLPRGSGLDRLLAGAERVRSAKEGLERVMQRGTALAEAPRRAGRVIEDEWVRRRDAIGGPDLQRYERGFRERAERLLAVETGSVAELQERMDRQRDRLGERRRAARREEDSDEQRRMRALERRQERRRDGG